MAQTELTILVRLFHIPVETIGDKFGVLKASIPTPQFPPVSYALLREIFPSAFAIAMLGASESLLSAVVSDSMIGGKHRPNTELIGQGVANLISPLFGGLPAITLFILFFYAGKYVGFIPSPVLAGILVIVSHTYC